MLQYRAVVNSELFHTQNVEKTGNFLLRRLFKTDSEKSHTSCIALNNMGYIQDAI